MGSQNIRKLSLIVSRADMEIVLKNIIDMGALEVTLPVELPEDAQFDGHITREAMDLWAFGANRERIELLGTEYTYILAGWISSKSEQALTEMLGEHTCAWEIEDPAPDELADAPVILFFPKLLRGMRGKGRRLFSPLVAIRKPVETGGDPEDGKETELS